ncbi:hypothetical protein Rsub_07037 [Raphidocelis subcapitata]|uniref:Apple domain-containing protein n=1 Tax=Raphidocelis subcapitata TaxID=307507 RepID=A0A2V0P9C9_9CHLO|nr:hypothetical protein Rsub_07037 [Raphidocelis subcapitata]|eukprot:GBF94503.1 hypothetical protein Rsub_07037 [Raphidocelis subcapitata]
MDHAQPRGPRAASALLLGLLLAACVLPAACRGGLSEAALSRPPARRLLADDTELVRQCDWAPGSTCTLGAEFASRTLVAAPESDAVARFVAQSLQCARATSAAACGADAACAWDPAFPDGQQGCFLSQAQELALQQQCAQPRYARALGALQACAAARRSCQCSDAAACAAVAAAGACQPLLGCWLSKLQGAPYDVLALAQAQLLRVGPLLGTLTPNATATGLATAAPVAGARRRLLQPTGLNAPVFDDPAAKKKPAAAASSSSAVSAAAVEQEGGQNQPILSDVAARAMARSSAGTGGELGNLESAPAFDAGLIQAGIIQPETTVATPTNPVAAGPSDGDGEALTYAPPSFWKCVADAAVAVDGGAKWGGVDYNSKKLTLETWLGSMARLPLLEWGSKAVDCFKVQALTAAAGGVGAVPDGQPGDSYEYALVTLLRAFGLMHDQFESVAAAAPGAPQAAAAVAAMGALTSGALPDAIGALRRQYNSSAAYGGDALLQARALLADAQWFVSEAAAVAESTGQPAAAFDGVVGYAAEQMRHLLRWLFSEQFGGPRAYRPTMPATTPAGIAAGQALATLGAAALPPAGVGLGEPRWLQARAMGTHALLSVALEAAALPTGAATNATRSAAAVVAAMAGAHVADFWGARIEAARAASDARMRDLALDDRASARGWRDGALGLAGALSGLRAQVAALNGDDAAAATKPAARARDGLAQLLGGVAVAANKDLPASAAGAAAAAVSRAAALGEAALACHGAAAAAGGAAHAAACSTLNNATADLVKASLGAELGASDALAAAAAADVALQWRCAARSPSECGALAGCARGVLAAPPTPGNYPLVAPLPLPGEAPSCQVDDARVTLRGADNATKAAVAVTPACAAFLQTPPCDALTAGGAAGCGKFAACRWQARGTRFLLQTSAGAAPAPEGAAAGVCVPYWPALLGGVATQKLRGSLSTATDACAAQKGSDGCGGVMGEVPKLAASRSSSAAATARIVAPAVAAAAAVAAAGAGFAFVHARRRASRSAAAAAAADDTPSGSGGSGSRSSRKRKVDKKRLFKRKIKRAEPGEYKPDLMRDSFTDYLARPAFRAGVAIASANIAAGPGGAGGAAGGATYENPLVALRDEVGGSGRLLLEPTLAFISGAGRRSTGPSGDGGGAVTGSLIDLGSGEVGSDDALASRRDGARGPEVVPEPEGEQPAAALEPRFSYNPFQPALSVYSGRSSRLGRGARRARLSGGGGGSVLSPRSSVMDGDADSQPGTPTSSCCHDSVCTFAHAPGAAPSVAGSAAGSIRGARMASAAQRARAAGRAREGGEGEGDGGLAISRASFASQDLLISIPSHPASERR